MQLRSVSVGGRHAALACRLLQTHSNLIGLVVHVHISIDMILSRWSPPKKRLDIPCLRLQCCWLPIWFQEYTYEAALSFQRPLAIFQLYVICRKFKFNLHLLACACMWNNLAGLPKKDSPRWSCRLLVVDIPLVNSCIELVSLVRWCADAWPSGSRSVNNCFISTTDNYDGPWDGWCSSQKHRFLEYNISGMRLPIALFHISMWY